MADEHDELTIDQLAQRTGMTVRNLRAHQARGLLPPPTVRGRTGYYGADHIARVELIRELQGDGYNLELIRKLLDGAAGQSSEVLRFTRSMRAPFVEEEPQVVTAAELAERFASSDPALLKRAEELGVLRRLDDEGRFEEISPSLARAGGELVALGVPAAKALEGAGHLIEEIPWDPEPVAQGYAVVRRASMASFPTSTDTMGPGIRQLAEEGSSLTAMDYFRAFESATNAANSSVAGPLQIRFDFLLTPTLGMLPMPIEKVPPFLGDEWSRHIQFVLPVSFARVPAISIPAGLHDGLPVGVQLVGQFGQEYDLLDFAEELEAMPGFGFQRPPGLE